MKLKYGLIDTLKKYRKKILKKVSQNIKKENFVNFLKSS